MLLHKCVDGKLYAQVSQGIFKVFLRHNGSGAIPERLEKVIKEGRIFFEDLDASQRIVG